MTAKADLLETRFTLNMSRITGLVQLLFSNDALKPTILFGSSSGVRADILRSVVVFLHATFEVALQSHIPEHKPSKGRYSGIDFDKALKDSGIEPTPFRSLYPLLTEMAKRRKRIVHEADLLLGELNEWSIADDWQLMMWLMGVLAFYYQLRISLRAANTVERAMYKKLYTAMASHVVFGNQLVAAAAVPRELRIQALKEIGVTLDSMLSALQLDPRAFIPDSG